MKKSKFKSLLLTTTLISSSLFGSKTNSGNLQLPQETTQEVVQTIATEDVLPPTLKKLLINIFNQAPDVKKIKETYCINYIEWRKGRDKYQQKIIETGCGNYFFKVSNNFTKEDFFKQARNQYLENAEKFFKPKAQSFSSNLGFERDQWWISVIIKPFLHYSFFDLIGFVNKLDIFEAFQEEALYDINNQKELFIGEICLFLLKESFYLNNDNQTAIFREMLIYFSNKYADIYNMQDLKECLTKYFNAREAIIQQDKITKEITNEIKKQTDLKKKIKEKMNELLLLTTKEEEELENSISIKECDDWHTELNNSAQKYKELILAHPKEKLVENVKTTIHESRKAAENLITKIVEQLSPKEHTSKEYKKHKTSQKTPSSVGRRAIQSNTSNPVEVFKQIKQARMPKTLEYLNAKYGEKLTKNSGELEILTIKFDSEEDWNEFVNKAKVEFSTAHNPGSSHQSQEIFFDFEQQKDNGVIEKQRIKGQLVSHYTHGRDTKTGQKITRKIKVTRCIQK